MTKVINDDYMADKRKKKNGKRHWGKVTSPKTKERIMIVYVTAKCRCGRFVRSQGTTKVERNHRD